MKKYICRFPGCAALLDAPGYCARHKRPAGASKPFENAGRSNEALYASPRWKRLRREHLRHNDCCARCGSGEDLAVDHIVPPSGNEELFFDAGNLQTLCITCHRVKTQIEIEGRKKRKRKR